jgi:hypothetical protein
VFKDGWIALLIVPIVFVGLFVNLVYLIGPIIEFLLCYILRLNMNFNVIAPDFKRFLFVLLIGTTIAFSIYDVSRYF